MRQFARLVILGVILTGGLECLAWDSVCDTDVSSDCDLQNSLFVYMSLEALSFRAGPCGTYGPAAWAEENEGQLASFAFVGPVSVVAQLSYGGGFLNRPLHLIGCTPASVESSQSVNAGVPVATREIYSYNANDLVDRREIVTSSATLSVDVLYSPAEYPLYIRGDCPSLSGASSTIRAEYDLLQRVTEFEQDRPQDCEAAAPASLNVRGIAAYADPSRLPVALGSTTLRIGAATTIYIESAAAASYTRDALGRLTRRDQTSEVFTAITVPSSSSTQTETLTLDYEYDAAGRLGRLTGARGANTNAVIDYGYDEAGRLVSMTSAGMSQGQVASSSDTFTYDPEGRIVTHNSSYALGANNVVTTFVFQY